MRKSFKKGMAMLLAAAMVFSTPVALDQTVAKAAGTELPEATYVYDFEGDQALQSKGTVTGAESAITPVKSAKGTVEVVKDGENSVLKLSDGGEEGFGQNYAKLPTKLFNGVTEESGLTLSMKVKIEENKNHEWSAIFNSTPAAYNEWNLFKVNANLVTDVNAGADAAQAWGGTGNDKNYTGHHDGAWHTITVTVTKAKITTYLDGVEKLSAAPAADSKADNFGGPLAVFATNQFNVLGCGGFPGTGKTGDKDISDILYDDIKVFNSALDASQVAKLLAGSEEDGFVKGVTAASAALSSDGKKINVTCTTEVAVPAENLKISVKKDGTEVASGSAVDLSADMSGDGIITEEGATVVSGTAVYAYTPTADGTYTFTVTAEAREVKGVKYQKTEKTTAALKVKKQGESYVNDADLFEAFKAEEGSEGLNITWKALNDATVKVVVTGGAKPIELTKPGTIKFSDLTAGTKYTVTLTATKAGYADKTATASYTYNTKFEEYTVGTTDKKTEFWQVFSKPYQINDKKTRVVELEVHGGAALYNNFVLAFANQEDFEEKTRGKDYKEYAAIRTDRWGWGGGDNKSLCGKDIQYVSHSMVSGGKTMKIGDTGFDAAFIAIMESAKATVEISRDGKMLEITMKIVSTKNAKNVITSTTRVELGTADGKDNGTGKVYMRMTPDNSYFIVKNVTEKTATGSIKPPVDPPVNPAKVSKVTLKVPNRKAGKTIYVKKGDKVTLKATVTGTGSYSKSVTWKSSKTKVATVKNGKVTAKKAGTAKITATSKTDKSKKATITIKVSKKAVKNKALKISPTKKSLKKGKSLTIKIKKMTKKTTDKITYKSSKKSVATVDAYGKVKAKKKGKATITVKCGKKKAKLKLTVK